MSTRRIVTAALIVVLAVGVLALLGCTAESEDATFLGYQRRPTTEEPKGLAIVQLESGVPAEAECTYSSLENGTPVKVTRRGNTYEIVAVSPDWQTP